MFEFVNYSAEQAQVLFLIILRVSGLFILAPILGHQTLPRTVKAGLLILVSLILTAAVELPPMPPVGSLWVLAGLALQELLCHTVISSLFS